MTSSKLDINDVLEYYGVMTKPVMKQFPTYFTEETYRRLRVAAAMQERSMTSLVAEIVEKELNALDEVQGKINSLKSAADALKGSE